MSKDALKLFVVSENRGSLRQRIDEGIDLLPKLLCSAQQVRNGRTLIPIFKYQVSVAINSWEGCRNCVSIWKKQYQGVRQLVFITGEQGIGKTTLVEAFLNLMEVEQQNSQHPLKMPLVSRGQCIKARELLQELS